MCNSAKVSDALRLRARAFRVCAQHLACRWIQHLFRHGFCHAALNALCMAKHASHNRFENVVIARGNNEMIKTVCVDLSSLALLDRFISDCIALGDTKSRLKRCALYAAAGAQAARRPRVCCVVSCVCDFFRCM